MAYADGSGDPKPVKNEGGKYYDTNGNPTYNIGSDGKVDWFTYSGFRRYQVSPTTRTRVSWSPHKPCHSRPRHGYGGSTAFTRECPLVPNVREVLEQPDVRGLHRTVRPVVGIVLRLAVRQPDEDDRSAIEAKTAAP